MRWSAVTHGRRGRASTTSLEAGRGGAAEPTPPTCRRRRGGRRRRGDRRAAVGSGAAPARRARPGWCSARRAGSSSAAARTCARSTCWSARAACCRNGRPGVAERVLAGSTGRRRRGRLAAAAGPRVVVDDRVRAGRGRAAGRGAPGGGVRPEHDPVGCIGRRARALACARATRAGGAHPRHGGSEEHESRLSHLRERLAVSRAAMRRERTPTPVTIGGGSSNFSRAQVPWGLDLAAAWSWRFLVIVAGRSGGALGTRDVRRHRAAGHRGPADRGALGSAGPRDDRHRSPSRRRRPGCGHRRDRDRRPAADLRRRAGRQRRLRPRRPGRRGPRGDRGLVEDGAPQRERLADQRLHPERAGRHQRTVA